MGRFWVGQWRGKQQDAGSVGVLCLPASRLLCLACLAGAWSTAIWSADANGQFALMHACLVVQRLVPSCCRCLGCGHAAADPQRESALLQACLTMQRLVPSRCRCLGCSHPAAAGAWGGGNDGQAGAATRGGWLLQRGVWAAVGHARAAVSGSWRRRGVRHAAACREACIDGEGWWWLTLLWHGGY